MMIYSIFIAAVLLSATSVVGVIGSHTAQGSSLSSPLFAQRIQQSIHKKTQLFQRHYLGNGNTEYLAFSPKTSLDDLIDNAVQLISQNPQLLDKIYLQIQKLPSTARVLQRYGITQQDLKGYFGQIKNDPAFLQQSLIQAKEEINTGGNPARPLSLNTSNPFACVITIIALLPVMVALLVLVLIVATLSIITCLNLNNCLTNLTDQIQNIITQRLLPP